MEGPDLQFSEAVIDNGASARHVVRFETGLLARQAAGSAAVYLDEDTMVLSATTAQSKPRDAIDFFPLTVDVEERMYAAGRIPGSFFRREGRPSEGAILTCRLIDRPLRPCFVKGLRNEVQVVVTVMALNPDKLYDVVAINAASLSTQLAGLPFTGPIGGVRVALIGDQWVGFPDVSQLEEATFDMVVAGRVTRRRRRRDHDGRGRVHRGDLEPGRTTAGPPRPKRSSPPGWRRPSRSSRPCATRRPSWPPSSRKATAEFPMFLDYQDDVYAAVADAATERAVRGHVDRRQAGPRGGHRGPQGQDRPSSLAPSFEGREKEITGAFRALTKKLVRQKILTEKVRIDGRGAVRHPHPVRRGRGDPAGARLGPVPARRDPDPGGQHAEHARHGAAARHPGAGDHQALHAQLQLPALLDR